MRLENTDIEGMYIVHGVLAPDLRGSLIKPFSEVFFEEKPDLNLNFKETWFTKSHKDVIRAMHLQVGEYAYEKMIFVLQGSVLDVVLDLREDSKTYKKWFEIVLKEETPIALYIPKGCAHGYKVLVENSITMYMATEVNVPKFDVGIRWDSFGYDWKIQNPIISEKDKTLPLLDDQYQK